MREPLSIVLASNSPRLAELLRAHGIRFRVVPAVHVEPEPRGDEQNPVSWAEALSYFKARSAAQQFSSGFVLAADTVVCLEGRIFGKPADLDSARHMLRTLSGTTHHVVTGVTLLVIGEGRRLIGHEISEVTMRDLPEAVLEGYLQSGLWHGKAGAYGVQDGSDVNIESINGSYTNVVGLPMELVEQMLAELHILSQVTESE
ncbi:MAG: Maf-like protein YhdE [Phycisphaerae bacterium]|nr:Maf-like protein YhdE [Phycisphaerae bacterium]